MTGESASTRAGTRRRLGAGTRRRLADLRLSQLLDPVWLLNLALVAIALLLYAGPVRQLGALAHPHIPAWAIALAYVPAELCVVHLHFRRGAHSFSLGEIPLVFGLIFCSGAGVVAACLLGSALVLQLSRRLPPIKLVFNLAQFTLATSIAVLVVHAVAPAGGQINPQMWLAVALGAQSGGLVTVVLIACAILLSEGRFRLSTLARMFATDGAVTLNNCCLALCGAVMAAREPAALPLLVVPLGTLFLAYRAYLSEQERQKQLELVHQTNRALSGTGEMKRALEALLQGCRGTFRAESAEIVLFGGAGEAASRTRFGPGEESESLVALDDAASVALLGLLAGRTGAFLLGPELESPETARLLGLAGVRQAIVAPLPGEEHLLGAILLTNRLGVGRGFERDDLRLLETLAGNASVALGLDRLEQTVQELSVVHERLHHAAHHDPLTGLANRAWFTEQVREALEDDPLAIAVLFIDLDNFKKVNDTLGHAAGDELLVKVAGRLGRTVRGDDVVARLGGDEFAIMLRAPEIVETAAGSVAARVVTGCRIDVPEENGHIPVRSSVGLAVCRTPGMSEEELINQADAAMYQAKKAGKDRFVAYGELAVRAA